MSRRVVFCIALFVNIIDKLYTISALYDIAEVRSPSSPPPFFFIFRAINGRIGPSAPPKPTNYLGEYQVKLRQGHEKRLWCRLSRRRQELSFQTVARVVPRVLAFLFHAVTALQGPRKAFLQQRSGNAGLIG